jgi:hypothetical protein
MHSLLYKLARLTDILSGFELVAGEHPDLDACLLQRSDCLWDIILQPILNSGASNQYNVALELVVYSVQESFSIVKIFFSLAAVRFELF